MMPCRIMYGIYAATSTAYLPHEFLTLARHIRRMDTIDTLIERITLRLKDLGISERSASIEATGSPDAIRYIRTRRAMPSASRLSTLADTLSATPEYLLGEVDENRFIKLRDEEDWETARKDGGFEQLANKSQSMPTFKGYARAENDSVPVYAAKAAARHQYRSIYINDTGHPFGGDDDATLSEVQCVEVDDTKIITRLSRVPMDPEEARNTYSIFLPVNCLFPAIPAGEPLLASTVRPISTQDMGLFYVRSSGSIFVVPGYVRRLTADYFDLEQFSGTGDFDVLGVQFRVPTEDVVRVDRIYTMPDLLR